MNRYDSYNLINALKTFSIACFIISLSACSGNDDDNNTTTETVTEIPEFIQSIAALTVAGGELKATITIDGGAPQQLTIDNVNMTSSGSIELSKENHTVTVTFTYTDATGSETVILATATKQVDLTNGSSTLSFDKIDYDVSHDDDNDGYNNIAEINAGTDPTSDKSTPIDTCVLDDNSLIGTCILG